MNKASDAKHILELIYSSIVELTRKEVQVMYLSNGASITVEFSAFRDSLKTVSIIIFQRDMEKKVAFLKNLIGEMLKGDSYMAIERAVRAYNEQFPF